MELRIDVRVITVFNEVIIFRGVDQFFPVEDKLYFSLPDHIEWVALEDIDVVDIIGCHSEVSNEI